MDAPINFALAAIRELHRTRTRRIHAVLQPGQQASGAATEHAATGYCLAHHVLEGAEMAARTNDTTAFGWYMAHFDANAPALTTPTAVGPRIVVAPNLDGLPRSGISETPYYVLGPRTTAAPFELREMATAAYALAARTGFGDLLAAHAVVTCLLRRRKFSDTLGSWTITRLPGTVFCDHVGDPVVLARDLIHEAGHNWLNDALAATSCKVSHEPRFYSPWKKTARPAFGFLHACWAFPLTMLYTARILEQTTGDLHRFLAAYLGQQRGLLAGTASDHARALTLLPDDRLRQHLHAIHHEALSL